MSGIKKEEEAKTINSQTDEELSVAVQKKAAPVLHPFPVLGKVYLRFFQ